MDEGGGIVSFIFGRSTGLGKLSFLNPLLDVPLNVSFAVVLVRVELVVYVTVLFVVALGYL